MSCGRYPTDCSSIFTARAVSKSSNWPTRMGLCSESEKHIRSLLVLGDTSNIVGGAGRSRNPRRADRPVRHVPTDARTCQWHISPTTLSYTMMGWSASRVVGVEGRWVPGLSDRAALQD